MKSSTKLVLVIVLTYFLQIYPYFHFHHSHEHDHLSIDFSFHPIDVEASHLPEHHGHDDQHEESDNTQWFASRIHLQRYFHQFEAGALPLAKLLDPYFTVAEPLRLGRDPGIPCNRFDLVKVTRGPPVLA